MEWQQIVGLGVWAAVVTAATNIFSTWLFGRSQRQQLAVYYATRICIELDRYAYTCADLISEETTYYASTGAAGSLFSQLPPLSVDMNTDWKALDVKFVDRVLSFQNEILRAQGEIVGEGYQLLPGAVASEPSEQAGLLGYRAFTLAMDLRVRYRSVASRERLHPWDYISVLKKKHDAKLEEYKQYIK